MKRIRIGMSCLSIIALSFSCAEEQADISPVEIDDVKTEASTSTTRAQSEFGLVNVEQQRQLRNNNKKSKTTEEKG